jgi:hypothetical protein
MKNFFTLKYLFVFTICIFLSLSCSKTAENDGKQKSEENAEQSIPSDVEEEDTSIISLKGKLVDKNSDILSSQGIDNLDLTTAKLSCLGLDSTLITFESELNSGEFELKDVKNVPLICFLLNNKDEIISKITFESTFLFLDSSTDVIPEDCLKFKRSVDLGKITTSFKDVKSIINPTEVKKFDGTASEITDLIENSSFSNEIDVNILKDLTGVWALKISPQLKNTHMDDVVCRFSDSVYSNPENSCYNAEKTGVYLNLIKIKTKEGHNVLDSSKHLYFFQEWYNPGNYENAVSAKNSFQSCGQKVGFDTALFPYIDLSDSGYTDEAYVYANEINVQGTTYPLTDSTLTNEGLKIKILSTGFPCPGGENHFSCSLDHYKGYSARDSSRCLPFHRFIFNDQSELVKIIRKPATLLDRGFAKYISEKTILVAEKNEAVYTETDSNSQTHLCMAKEFNKLLYYFINEKTLLSFYEKESFLDENAMKSKGRETSIPFCREKIRNLHYGNPGLLKYGITFYDQVEDN